MVNTDSPTLIEKNPKSCCTCFTYINMIKTKLNTYIRDGAAHK